MRKTRGMIEAKAKGPKVFRYSCTAQGLGGHWGRLPDHLAASSAPAV